MIKAPSSSKSCSVFVGNIPYDVQEDQLRTIFSTVGQVVSFRLMYDKNTRQPKGYGFCEYKDPETAYAAMRNLNNVECGGRPLRVDWADHELRNTEGVMKAPGRATAIDHSLKQTKLKNSLLQEFQERLTDETAEELSLDARLHCDIASLLTHWSTPQLLNILSQIQRLVFESPDTARQLLTNNPQFTLAVSHIAFLVGLVADPSLPMSPEDAEYASERIQQLKNSRIAPQQPLVLLKAAPTAAATLIGAAGGSSLIGTARATTIGTLSSSVQQPTYTSEQKQMLREQLALLTPDQIASLPDEVKLQMREIINS